MKIGLECDDQKRITGDRRINKERQPGENNIQYNLRMQTETDLYKTTVYYKLFQMRMDLHYFKTIAATESIRNTVQEVIEALDGLTCEDFGENEYGEYI